ncbi:helix-turn-helix domain-containing protein [Halosimplex aquaticum]|uniref:Helix-turn-helix domain-containing protein n=1 Tax=Halosimplex aquaticum TaxID=3026162 RepID=A0ABD5XZ53_9EURY|nr:helix-turn-helix domain-containing protein [Halosimplex aquaticum]
MTVIGEFTVPAGAFLLGDALGSVDGTVTVERMVVDGGQVVTPYVWVATGDFEAFESALRGDASVGEFAVVERHEDESLYRIEWDSDHTDLFAALDGVAATVLNAEGRDGVWVLRAMFSDRGAVSTFDDRFCATHEGVKLDRLYRYEDPSSYGKYEVTEKQRAALTAARDAGYFAVPRECSLQDVADELGISRNAASARLRRGQDALVGNTLDHDHRDLRPS